MQGCFLKAVFLFLYLSTVLMYVRTICVRSLMVLSMNSAVPWVRILAFLRPPDGTILLKQINAWCHNSYPLAIKAYPAFFNARFHLERWIYSRCPFQMLIFLRGSKSPVFCFLIFWGQWYFITVRLEVWTLAAHPFRDNLTNDPQRMMRRKWVNVISYEVYVFIAL